MKLKKQILLKVLCGSRAHGLHNKDSDYDYRAVYIIPTKELLSLGNFYKGSTWVKIQGKEDNVAYELGHFLHLASKSNPSILEVFLAPVIEANEDGQELRKLFPYIWSSKYALDAFIGYGLNQRKKFLNKKDSRPHKYAVAYVRVLFQLCELLDTGIFNVRIQSKEIREMLLKLKKGMYTAGYVIDIAEKYINIAKEIYKNKPKKERNQKEINDFLIKMRKKYWEF